eukprot:29613-Pelagococcus_subviridis.AAC.3
MTRRATTCGALAPTTDVCPGTGRGGAEERVRRRSARAAEVSPRPFPALRASRQKSQKSGGRPGAGVQSRA